MADKKTVRRGKVIPLRTEKAHRASEKKWGVGVVRLGFVIVPSLLFRAQGRLGLSATQLAVLLQIAEYWWDPQRRAYPGTNALADRLKLSQRQVRRHIAALEGAGFLKRIERTAAHRGKLTNEYDLAGLVEKLKKLEPEFREASEMRRRVSQRGGIGPATSRMRAV